MDTTTIIIIILGILLITIVFFWIRRTLKMKKKATMIFNDIIEDFNKAEQKMLASEGEADPYQILLDIKKDRINERRLIKNANNTTDTNEEPDRGNRTTGLYKKIGGFTSTDAEGSGATQGTESPAPERSLPQWSDRRQDVPIDSSSISGSNQGSSTASDKDNRNSFISGLRRFRK